MEETKDNNDALYGYDHARQGAKQLVPAADGCAVFGGGGDRVLATD